jgi:hypothetical protein
MERVRNSIRRRKKLWYKETADRIAPEVPKHCIAHCDDDDEASDLFERLVLEEAYVVAKNNAADAAEDVEPPACAPEVTLSLRSEGIGEG